MIFRKYKELRKAYKELLTENAMLRSDNWILLGKIRDRSLLKDDADIIRCKDCDNYIEAEDFIYCSVLDLHFTPDEEFFCAKGERRKP